MSTNGVNSAEDTDMAECEEEKVVTMMDVLQEQQEFEDDANAVLGASDDKNCTFPKGYIKRQAIYACLTCCEEARNYQTMRAGVCLACSLACHENHELIELYTKRNFRCDCGNPKFKNNSCQFVAAKPDLNEENRYNQNFSGLYCTCHRPYPDPEATFEDDMIQCIICEDWLHASHLETSMPTSDYAEMICKACMDKNEFLHSYSDIAVNNVSDDVDILTVNNDTCSANNLRESNGMIETVNGCEEELNTNENKNELDDAMPSMDTNSEIETVTKKNDSDAPKSDELADTTTENKINDIVPEQAESVKNTEDSEVPQEEILPDMLEQTLHGDNKQTENTENNDPVVDSSTTNENAVETKTKSEESFKEDESTEAPTLSENQAESGDQSNDNSIIESIEKLENELGNVDSIESGNDNEHLEQNKTSADAKNEKTEPNLTDADQSIENNKHLEQNITAADGKNEETDQSLSNTDQVNENNENKSQDAIITDETKSNLESDAQVNAEQDNKENDVEMNEDNKNESQANDTDENRKEALKNGISEETLSELNDSTATTENNANDIKRKLSTEETENVTSKKPKLDGTSCVKPKGIKKRFKGATFWPSNFRQKLCTCNVCMTMYKDLCVLFLTDPEDTVTAYEALGRQKTNGIATSQYEKGLEALTSLDRTQQINALTEYNKMRDKLLDYLKSFKDRKEIVKEEDIKAFFAGMKPKRESDGVYFCR